MKYNVNLKQAFLLILLVSLFAGCSTTAPVSNTTVEKSAVVTSTVSKKVNEEPKVSSEAIIQEAAKMVEESGISIEGEFWCMGKNDTCENKTFEATDLFCNSCDSNKNNIEDSKE